MRGYVLGGALVFAVLSGAALGAALGATRWVIRHGISDQDDAPPPPDLTIV